MTVRIKHNILQQFILAALVCAVFVLPRLAAAALTLPATACDEQWNFPNLNHLGTEEAMEDGAQVFQYGPTNQDFVSEAGGIVTFEPVLLFEPTPQALFKVYALTAACAVVYGDTSPAMIPGRNVITYNRDSNEVQFNTEEPSRINSGFPRYLGFDVWDGQSRSSYSYLVDLNDLRNPVSNDESQFPRPVLIVPGIMGTEMFKENEKLWPDIDRMFLTKNDNFMDPLAFIENGTPLDNSVNIGEMLRQPSIFYDYSKKLTEDFVFQGYTEEINLFTFPYDWRNNLSDIAQNELKQKIDQILTQTGFSQLDIIAHSQGGLIVKHLLFENSSYQSKINKLVFLGTPHLGAPKAAKALLFGDPMGVKFLALGLDPQEVKRISQNLPSVYQLLPSLEYFSHGQAYLAVAKTFGPFVTDYSILNYEDTKQTLKDFGLNPNLIDRAESFHGHEYDNYDFSSSEILAYNIMGCQEATITQIWAGKNGRYWLIYGPGDATVPLVSASNVFGTDEFFAKKSDHGSMMTDDGIRQLIVNLITGSSLVTGYTITQNPAECKFNGRQVSVHSPVELHIYDQDGNHVGPNESGNMDLEISGVQYDVLGENKFAFLPEGLDYNLKLVAVDNGEFDFYSVIIENGSPVSTAFYAGLPVTNSSLAEIQLTADNNQEILLDGQAVVPSAILNEEDLADLISPVTTAGLIGLMGQPGLYRSDVEVTLSATDSGSGVLKIFYSTDEGRIFNEYIDPLIFFEEGEYVILYYSIDKRGNREDGKEVSFAIDKTVPKITIQFDPAANDLVFLSADQITDHDDVVAATDEAGNQTVLKLNEKERKKKLRAEIQELSYNGIVADITKTLVRYNWQYDKKGQLKRLEQHAESRRNFNITAIYKPDKTKLTGKDQDGKIKLVIPGLVILKIETNNGDFGWGY